ncbi:MAG: tetratricopeptide repeat protein [Candidatus Omnitrophica bacterium]|nr:tetratricopeptide repeat protein [Candidatus Omnitrophota bacterium]
MRCKFNFTEISLYADGQYSGRKRQEIEDHLPGCSECKERLEKIGLLRDSLHNLAPIEESEGFDFEFNRRLKDRLEGHGAPTWDAGIAAAFARLREAVVYPVPAAVKVAVSFILVVAVVAGLQTKSLQKIPTVEFVAGDVKIYRPADGRWTTPRVNMRLKAGDKIRSQEGAIFNIASNGRYKARIKDDSLIVISKLDSGWNNIDTGFSLSHGDLMVNTTEKFKGSSMEIRTPSCEAEVVGTAFMVRVEPELKNMTWLGVLHGKVEVISEVHPLKEKDEKRAVVYVSSGQKTTVKPYSYPTLPELFSEKEWRMMQELYQLSQKRQILLLVGTEPDRIDRLLKPAPVYIPDMRPRTVPASIQRTIATIVKATDQKDYNTLDKSIKSLEQLLEKHPNPSYDVEILMFMGSHYHYIKDYDNAIRVFRQVIRKYPDSEYASLAQCAMATIYQNDLKDTNMAKRAYTLLLKAYPNSVDAVRAREALTSIR